MKDEKKAPKLRFKGFTDDWEQCKLSDVADRFDNLRVPVTANLRKNGDTPYYGANGIQDYVDGYTHDGEYILVAEDGANNLKNYPINYVSGRIWVNNHAHVLQAIPNLANTRFLGYEIGRSNIISLLVGGGRAKLNADALMNMSLNLPKMHEQELITEIVKTISHTITLHEEKKRQLECLKSALLQKMFADKSGYPAVRFKGFGGNWKEQKFGELGTIEMCKRIFKDQTTDDGEIPFYKIGTFGGRPNAYISREIFERYKRLYPYPTKGDILISTSGSIGRVVEYTGQEAYYQDSNIVWLNHNDLISNSFLKYLYKTVNWNGVEGSTIKRLYNNNILKTKIRIPSSCEQEKIGGILSTLDHLLSHHQQKIDTVESIKQSLLQNMFI